jgi:hypothetical protein
VVHFATTARFAFDAPVTSWQAYRAGRMPLGFPWAAAFILSFGCFGFFFSFRLSLFPIVAVPLFVWWMGK